MMWTWTVRRALSLAALSLAAACSQAPVEPDPAETAAPSPVPAERGPLEDSTARQMMEDLAGDDLRAAQAAVVTVLRAKDVRFTAVFLEMMRANEIGIASGVGYDSNVAALEDLSGQRFGANWPAWVEWYGGTDLAPPLGFTGWKGRLLGRLDPRFASFLQDDFPSELRVEEIQWGGVRVDGIPALDEPAMLEASEAEYLTPDEAVFGLLMNGDARAYPLRILDWHEMANDVVGGVPVSLAYCTLCGAAIAYAGEAPDGQVYTFGSSGFLYRSNKLMYDRQTRTLWNQLTGRPVMGPLADQDLELDLLPVVLTTWRDWRSQHPDTKVLSLDTGYERVYVPGAPYGHYFSAEGTMFPVWQRNPELETKDQIYALRVDGIPKAYPLETLVAMGVVNDVIGETPIVLIAGGGVVQVEGQSLRAGPVTYRAGAEVRAYERKGETFRAGEAPDQVLDSSGRVWQVTEEALVGPEGERAPRVSGHLAYWFGWYAFFPQTLVYEGED